MEFLIEALFQWQQLRDFTLYIGYPSRGIVHEVCVDDDPCFPPTDKVVEVLRLDRVVLLVRILHEVDGLTRWEFLDRTDALKGE